LAPSTPNISIEGQFCQACTLGKHNRKNAPKTSLHRVKAPFDLIHTQMCVAPSTTPLYLVFVTSLHSLMIVVGLGGSSSSRKRVLFFFQFKQFMVKIEL
jgi:hypothetical protein